MLLRRSHLVTQTSQRQCLRVLGRGSSTNAGVAQTMGPSSGYLDPEYDNARPFHQIPGPKGLPYVGTLFQYTRGPFSIERKGDALLSRYQQYGRIFKETIAGKTIVHLADPEYFKTVYAHEGRIPHIPPLLETTQLYRKYRGLSPGLGNTNGEEWYRLRSAVQQMMMRPKAVTIYLPGINEVADDFIARIEKQRNESNHVKGFTNEISKWTLESSSMNCFETRLGCFEAGPDSFQQKMIDANNDIFVLSTKLRYSLPIHKFIGTRTWKKLVEKEDYFFYQNGQRLVDETIEKIKALEKEGNLTEDKYKFLTYMLSKKELSYKDISIITLSLFGDGLGTTSPTTIGMLYCIARHPEKQRKLYQEIKKTVQEGAPVTAQTLSNMPYLKACVKEGFRFFPIGLDVSRTPTKNIVIGGYQIPAGTDLDLNNYILLRSADYFDQPDTYLPERWLRGGSAHDIHPYLLTPFGHGPRMCAGRRFAEQEMYVFIIKLLHRFKLEWHHGEMKQKFRMLLVPDQEANLTFTDRT